jgi:tyrosinase
MNEGVSPPSQHVLIPNYRHFTVQVQLVGHAFDGSYWLQLVCKEKVVGSFAVLTRGEGTNCAACLARHKAGGLVRGVIDIPEDVIHPLLEDIVKDQPTASTSNLAASLKECFGARIVGPSDVLLAEAIESNGKMALESHLVPELILLSAAAARPANQDGAIKLIDWKNHGDLLGSDWMRA